MYMWCCHADLLRQGQSMVYILFRAWGAYIIGISNPSCVEFSLSGFLKAPVFPSLGKLQLLISYVNPWSYSCVLLHYSYIAVELITCVVSESMSLLWSMRMWTILTCMNMYLLWLCFVYMQSFLPKLYHFIASLFSNKLRIGEHIYT